MHCYVLMKIVHIMYHDKLQTEYSEENFEATVNPLKMETNLNNRQRFSSYRAVNTPSRLWKPVC